MRHLSKNLFFVLGLLLVCLGIAQAAQGYNPPVFFERQDAIECEKKGDYLGALVRYRVNLEFLQKVHEQHPEWLSALVPKAIAEYQAKVAELKSLAAKQILKKEKSPLTSGSSLSLLYENGQRESDPWKAMNEIEEYLINLEFIHQRDPDWQKELVEDRIKKSQTLMDHLETAAMKPIADFDASGEQSKQ